VNPQPSNPNRLLYVVVAATLISMVVVLFGSLQYATTRMQVTM
jgi:hypothetical protein